MEIYETHQSLGLLTSQKNFPDKEEKKANTRKDVFFLNIFWNSAWVPVTHRLPFTVNVPSVSLRSSPWPLPEDSSGLEVEMTECRTDGREAQRWRWDMLIQQLDMGVTLLGRGILEIPQLHSQQTHTQAHNQFSHVKTHRQILDSFCLLNTHNTFK